MYLRKSSNKTLYKKLLLRSIYYYTLFNFFFFYSFKVSADEELIKKGKYIFQASGGCSCHTDKNNEGKFLAGGRPIKTPFGIFFGTNITPDFETGIGSWSDKDFIMAMTKGVSPKKKKYFPVFPYTSFQLMSKNDLLALKAYIFSIPPVKQKNKNHELFLPIGRTIPMFFWKKFVWTQKKFEKNTEKTKTWNRGSYLVQAISHCGECHTPRDMLGGINYNMNLAGSNKGHEGELAPNITPDINTGIGSWSKVDITYFLQTGIKPDGDSSQGLMGEIIDRGFQYLNKKDLESIAEYISKLDPIINNIRISENNP